MWEQYKDEIYRLYITEDRSLTDVREIMNQEKDFYPAYIHIYP